MKTTTLKCVLCNNDIHDKWGESGGYTIYICTLCGLGVTSPFPDYLEMKKNNRDFYQLDDRISLYLSRRANLERRYERYLKIIKSIRPSGRLLDIGCNIGLFLEIARRNNYMVAGVEINEECALYAKNNFDIDVYTDYLQNLHFSDNSFDVVTLFDVLEHNVNFQELLREVYRITKPGGVVVVQSPNIDSVMASITNVKWFWLDVPDHLYHFTPKTLKNSVEKCGFDVILLNTWDQYFDFSSNIVEFYFSNNYLGRFFKKLINKSMLVTLFVFLMQVKWINENKGALIEIYGVKQSRL